MRRTSVQGHARVRNTGLHLEFRYNFEDAGPEVGVAFDPSAMNVTSLPVCNDAYGRDQENRRTTVSPIDDAYRGGRPRRPVAKHHRGEHSTAGSTVLAVSINSVIKVLRGLLRTSTETLPLRSTCPDPEPRREFHSKTRECKSKAGDVEVTRYDPTDQ